MCFVQPFKIQIEELSTTVILAEESTGVCADLTPFLASLLPVSASCVDTSQHCSGWGAPRTAPPHCLHQHKFAKTTTYV